MKERKVKMRYTASQKEQLKSMGFDVNQIDAILAAKEEDAVNRVEEKKAIESSQYEVKGVLKERPVNHDELLSVISISDLQCLHTFVVAPFVGNKIQSLIFFKKFICFLSLSFVKFLCNVTIN